MDVATLRTSIPTFWALKPYMCVYNYYFFCPQALLLIFFSAISAYVPNKALKLFNYWWNLSASDQYSESSSQEVQNAMLEGNGATFKLMDELKDFVKVS